MILSSQSSLDDVKAAYVDNASYEEQNSIPMARTFITACRILLLKMPVASAQKDSSITLSPQIIQQEMEQARRFVILQQPGGGVRHFSFEEFRSEGGGPG